MSKIIKTFTLKMRKTVQIYDMKREAQIVIVLLYFALHITACQWGETKDPSVDQNNLGTEQPEIKYGKVIVDNLRMRNSSGLGGQEITQIGKNQFVRLTGNQSDTTEAIQIRGETIPHYWYEVIFNGDTGWIYGGGMEILDSDDPRSAGGVNDFRIEPGVRAGIVNIESTHESLVQQLGPETVIKEDLHVGEGEWVQGTIIYPNTNNEIMIYWQNEDFETIRQIIISKPGGQWQTTSGIHIGQSIQEVTKINGSAFNLTGFQWDYAGKTLNWQGGNLSQHLTLVFDYNGDISIYPFLIGDKIISSDNSSLLKLDPRVRQIIVSITE